MPHRHQLVFIQIEFILRFASLLSVYACIVTFIWDTKQWSVLFW